MSEITPDSVSLHPGYNTFGYHRPLLFFHVIPAKGRHPRMILSGAGIS
jgi:hypothetical protein